MALEFAGKNVLLVDGEKLCLWLFLILHVVRYRFYCKRYDIERNRSDGKRCRRKESHFCQLFPTYKVKLKNYHITLSHMFHRHSNVYGIDMPSRAELVAYERDEASIAQVIGADLVIFQTLPDLISAVRRFNPEIKTFDCSVFTGEYVTGGIDEGYLENLERLRADNARNKVQYGEIGVVEGKGGGGVKVGGNKALHEAVDNTIGCSGPMNGADDTIGLHNSWTGSR